MELCRIVSGTYAKDADLRERSKSFDLKNREIFTLDYYYHVYGGFQSFVDFFAGRAVRVGIVYFLYYLYQPAENETDTSLIKLGDFGVQQLSVSVIVAFFLYAF